jgi:hypothetical protein
MKKYLIFLMTLALLPACGFSQELPKSFMGMMSHENRVIGPADVDNEHRKFLWKDTVSDRRGYLSVVVPVGYLRIIDEVSKNKDFSVLAPKFQIAKMEAFGFKYMGNLREDEFRNSVIFQKGGGEKLMLTVWSYKSAGANVTLVEEFFNQKVSKHSAVLALTSDLSKKIGLWKLTWWTDNDNYEMYVTDELDGYGIPKKSVDEVLSLAHDLVLEDDK